MDSVIPYVVAIVPTIVAAAFFYVIVKRIMEADRRERLAQSRFEADEERRRAAGEAPGAPGSDEPLTRPRTDPGEEPERSDDSEIPSENRGEK